jgi:uncharacterized protein YhaN
VILVGVAAWVYSLTQQMSTQATLLAEIKKSADESREFQLDAIKSLLAKDRDAETHDPRKFVDSLRELRKDLDEAKFQADKQERLARVVYLDNKKLDEELAKVTKEKIELEKQAKAAEADKEDKREEVKQLKKERDALYDTPNGELTRKYSTTLYAAIAGWIVALLSTLGLLAVWLAKSPIDPEASTGFATIKVPIPGVSPENPPAEEPPHQII